MSAAALSDTLLRYGRAAMHRLAEIVHVCAIYLGIVVLVALTLAATMPALREQAHDMRMAIMDTLRQDGDPTMLDLARLTLPPPAADGAAVPAGSIAHGSPTEAFHVAMRAAAAGRPPALMTAQQFQSLRSYLARKYRVANNVAGALIHVVFDVGRELSVDPQLLLAVISIESRYNPYAESHVGAQGLMQVLTRVHKDKFESFPEGPLAALQPVPNIRVGTQILSDCVRRRGSIEGGLACYVGATGPSDGGYGAKVLAERRRIALASGIPVGR